MNRYAAACAGFAVFLMGAAPPPPASKVKSFHVIEAGVDAWTVVDPQQIETLSGGSVRRAWTIRVVRNIMATPPGQPGYVRTLADYDCQRREYRWREFTAFSRSGEPLVSRQNPGYAWESPDTAIDTRAAYLVVCGEGRGRGVVVADSAAKLVISLMSSWDAPAVTASAPPAKAKAPAKAPATPPPKKAPAPAKPAGQPKTVSLNTLWP